MKRIFFIFLMMVCLTAVSRPSPAAHTAERQAQKAIVLAVFGTSYPNTLNSILSIQRRVQQRFPDIPVHLAFTSEIIRAKWAKRAQDKTWRAGHPEVPDFLYSIKNPLATIAGLQDQGYRHIAVQSTHIFAGEEYQNLKAEIEALDGIRTLRKRDKPFQKIVLGRPALGESGDAHPYKKDILRAAAVLQPDVTLAKKNDSALVYMGHGNEVFLTSAYIELQEALRDSNPDTAIFIGTVEGFPAPERVLKGLQQRGVKKVTLLPLMVVAGDHAANDMAGDEPDSWQSLFEKAGLTVKPILRGLGEIDAWADIYIQNLKDAMQDSGF